MISKVEVEFPTIFPWYVDRVDGLGERRQFCSMGHDLDLGYRVGVEPFAYPAPDGGKERWCADDLIQATLAWRSTINRAGYHT